MSMPKSGETPALTLATGGGTPNGVFLGYVTGPSFASMSTGKQMTVMIDEMHHAARVTSPDYVQHNGLSLSEFGQKIAAACGTTVP